MGRSANCCQTPGYNREVPRFALLLIVAFCILTGCRSNLENRDQVRTDLMDYLSKRTGLDLKSLDIDVTKVEFKNDQAKATVSFRPKGDTSIQGGMVMIYTLASKGGHWVVIGRSDSQGHGFGGAPVEPDNLPPGHPASGLPPGHPPVDAMPATPPDGAPQGQPK